MPSAGLSSGARFSLSPDYLRILASFSIKSQPDYQLETSVRFTIKNLAATADSGEVSTQWRFSAAALRARTTPLVLEVPFLKTGDAYSFEAHFVSDNQGCEYRASWDERSIYPATQGEAVTPSGRGAGPDELNLTGTDFSLVITPLPLHGRVLLPDGRPGRDLKVQIASADGSATGTVTTDTNGYYVTPRYTSYGLSPRISVVALSDQAAFRTYTATAGAAFTEAYVCAENLGRHDIQLQAP